MTQFFEYTISQDRQFYLWFFR